MRLWLFMDRMLVNICICLPRCLFFSVGQEDIDEVISRDIHRTFPEYPLFAFEQVIYGWFLMPSISNVYLCYWLVSRK